MGWYPALSARQLIMLSFQVLIFGESSVMFPIYLKNSCWAHAYVKMPLKNIATIMKQKDGFSCCMS